MSAAAVRAALSSVPLWSSLPEAALASWAPRTGLPPPCWSQGYAMPVSVAASAAAPLLVPEPMPTALTATALLQLRRRSQSRRRKQLYHGLRSATVAAFVASPAHAARRFSSPRSLASSEPQSAPRTTMPPSSPRISLGEALGRSSTGWVAAPQIVGHRGAPHLFLENTLPGFRHCVDLRCHAVELDVFLIRGDDAGSGADNGSGSTSSSSSCTAPSPPLDNLICFHGGSAAGGDARPGDLDGYVRDGGGRNVRDLTLAEVQALEFNPDHPEFACPPERIRGAHVPSLREVLAALKGSGTRVQIELKSHGTTSDGSAGLDLLASCLALVDELDIARQVRYSSFDHDLLRALHRLRPDATLGALFTQNVPPDFVQRARDCGAREVHLRYDTCTAARVAEAHAACLGSLAWVRGPIGMREDFAGRFRRAELVDKGEARDGESVPRGDSGPGDVFDGEDGDCYRAILDTGVQSVCCNKPDLLKAILVAEGKYTEPIV